MLDAAEILRNPNAVARHGLACVDVPNVGPTPCPRPAFALSRTPVPLWTPAPGFAKDNDAVFAGPVGLTVPEVAALEASGTTSRVPRGISD